jgi:hypothetical protein
MFEGCNWGEEVKRKLKSLEQWRQNLDEELDAISYEEE